MTMTAIVAWQAAWNNVGKSAHLICSEIVHADYAKILLLNINELNDLNLSNSK